MGPLAGFKVIELAGLGPCPMAGMLLADMGAEVICIDRGPINDPLYAKDMSRRGKKSIIIDLKTDDGRNTLLKLVESADALIEGFRPGVCEKLGFGPEVCFERNPKLVFGRMTGWGQSGPLAHTAGHDINYISLSGALHAIGTKGSKPVIPLNLVGDFGGGSLFLVSGVLAALLEAQKSGKGQVVDAAMLEGSANLMWMCHSFNAVNSWDVNERESNILDGGAFFYDSYETADNRYLALGSIEPQFFEELIQKAQLDREHFNLESQWDSAQWPQKKTLLASVFREKTLAQWCELLEGSDACFSPILTAEEAPFHPHNKARNNYVEVDGYPQPAPAPRFSRTESCVAHGLRTAGADTQSVLEDIGLSCDDIQHLYARQVIA